jgi:hypothetical protein
MKVDLPKELLDIAHGTDLDKTILSLAANLVEAHGAGAIASLRSTVIEASKSSSDDHLSLRQASDLVASMEADEEATLSRADKIGSLVAEALGKVGASLLRQLIP